MLYKNHRSLSSLFKTVSYPFSDIFQSYLSAPDSQKASIRLMFQPLKYYLRLSELKTFKQYYRNLPARVYQSKSAAITLGEAVNMASESDMNTFDIKWMYDKFLAEFSNFWDKDLYSYDLHRQNYLQNLLKVFAYLQQNSKWTLTRMFLLFLSHYVQNFNQLPKYHYEVALTYLSQRFYVAEFVLEHVKQKYTEIPQINMDSNELVQNLRIICCRLQTIYNLQNAKQQGFLKPDDEIPDQQLKAQYIQAYLKALEDPQILLQAAINIDPSVWLLNDIIQQHKDRFSPIFAHLLASKQRIHTQYHRRLIQNIFDKVYLFYDKRHTAQVLNFLKLYQHYCTMFKLTGSADKIGPSLLFLCRRFSYQSQDIAEFFYETRSNEKLAGRNLIYPLTIKKNRIINRNSTLSQCNLLGICEQIWGKENQSLRKSFVSKFQASLELGLQGYPGLQGFISQNNPAAQRQRTILPEQAYTYLSLTGQYYYQQSAQIASMHSQLQKQMSVRYSSEHLQLLSYPINLKNSVGARLNVLFQNLRHYTKYNPNTEQSKKIYTHITKNKGLIQIIQKNIAYPSLFKAVILYQNQVQALSQTNKGKSNKKQESMLQSSHERTDSHMTLDNFIRLNRKIFSSVFENNLKFIMRNEDFYDLVEKNGGKKKPKKSQNDDAREDKSNRKGTNEIDEDFILKINRAYKPGIQYLTTATQYPSNLPASVYFKSKVALSQQSKLFAKQQQKILLNIFNDEECRNCLLAKNQQNFAKTLKDELYQELRGFYHRNPRAQSQKLLKISQYYMEYPYFSDFLVVYRNQVSTLFILKEGETEPSGFQKECVQYFKENTQTIIIKNTKDAQQIFSVLGRFY